MEIAIVLFVIAGHLRRSRIKVVPQQHAWVVERLGKYHGTLSPGLNFLVPFVDKVAYRHSLKEIPLDVPSQVCITRDNTQLQVDGILYFQVTDPMRASYGSSNYIVAVTQLAQTSLRSVIGKLELDKTFEERDIINAQVVQAIDEAALNWGVKVLRYEIKDLTPPKEILHAMQSQITAEREKRALIAASEGRRQEQINIATGEREASIARSEGEKQADINQAQGQAAAIVAVAEATADAIRKIAEAIRQPGGEQAVQLEVAEKGGRRVPQRRQRVADHAHHPGQHVGGVGAHRVGDEDGAGQPSRPAERAAALAIPGSLFPSWSGFLTEPVVL
jgi:regulator of protease activity HflC (stomatin/prohibitin superfamily)